MTYKSSAEGLFTDVGTMVTAGHTVRSMTLMNGSDGVSMLLVGFGRISFLASVDAAGAPAIKGGQVDLIFVSFSFTQAVYLRYL